MKHLHLLLTLAAVALLTACGTPEPTDYAEAIVGYWQLTEAYIPNDDNSVKESLTSQYPKDYSLQFLADGTVFIIDHESDESEPWQQSYQVVGDALAIHYQPVEDTDTYVIRRCNDQTMELLKTTFPDIPIVEIYQRLKNK